MKTFLQQKLFYQLSITRLFYIMVVRIYLYTLLFKLLQLSNDFILFSLIGILINAGLIGTSLITYNVIDRLPLRLLFVLIILSQLLILLLLLFKANISLILMVFLIVIMFIFTALETMVFDKSIKVMLPDQDRGRGITMGLLTSSISYIVPPFIASTLPHTASHFFLNGTIIVLSLIYIYLLTFIKDKTKLAIERNLKFVDFFTFSSDLNIPAVLQLLMSFSLTTLWFNFINFLALPLLKVEHSQLFIGLTISFVGVGSLMGALTASHIHYLEKKYHSLLYCYLGSVLCIILFLLFSEKPSICLITTFAGGMFSYWSYGVAQHISQTDFNEHKLAGFYSIRGSFSALILIFFYLISLAFSKNLYLLTQSLIIFYAFYSVVYFFMYFKVKNRAIEKI